MSENKVGKQKVTVELPHTIEVPQLERLIDELKRTRKAIEKSNKK